jgi:hypothetical protein
MKIAVVCALLALVPLSSLRMVCVDAHGLVAHATAPVAGSDQANTSAEDECARVCKRRPAPAAVDGAAAPVIKCLLVADPTCEVLAMGGVAVLPTTPALPLANGIAAVEFVLAAAYLPPAPARHTPPPKRLV